MAVNQMNVGRDYTFGYYDANSGGIVDLGDIQNVKITPQHHDIASRPYNDLPRFGYIPDGYKVTFSIVRTKPDLENFQVALDAQFNAGATIKAGFLNETVHNPDDSVSRYQYLNFVFKVTETGDISREKVVTMTAEGMASTKVQIS